MEDDYIIKFTFHMISRKAHIEALFYSQSVESLCLSHILHKIASTKIQIRKYVYNWRNKIKKQSTYFPCQWNLWLLQSYILL